MGRLRSASRNAFFRFLRRLFATDDAKRITADALRGLLHWQPDSFGWRPYSAKSVYPDLGIAQQDGNPALRNNLIIITARFRSGSTLLWNLFRCTPGCTAYYEPFNERRWFDPRRRGGRIDPTHKNVDDYWREYEGLTALGEYYREEWTERNFLMDATFWDPAMKCYVELLIERASGIPVLQFNRIDFRLPWFRQNFPHAKMVHLYRYPRDQWCSSLVDMRCFPKDGEVAEFEPYDHYYLLRWARDLKYHFPFLDERSLSHPYELFYYLWRLSHWFGTAYADYSIAFEHLVERPDETLAKLFPAIGLKLYDIATLKRLIVKPEFGRWRAYADDAWFKKHEAHCENVLGNFIASVSPLHRGATLSMPQRHEAPRGVEEDELEV